MLVNYLTYELNEVTNFHLKNTEIFSTNESYLKSLPKWKGEKSYPKTKIIVNKEPRVKKEI